MHKRWLINSSRVYLWRYNAAFAAETASGMCVLDAGAGSAPYRNLFTHAIYETADFQQVDKDYYPETTYTCDLESLPIEGERFDRVVFNQVLEHLPRPLVVLRELHRVLKPGGRIICTCPFYYEEHEKPYDFYRYTQFAHQHLFDEAGFIIERLEWMEGYFGTIAYQFDQIYRNLPLHPKALRRGGLRLAALPLVAGLKLFALLLAGVLYRLDLRAKWTATGHPKNYVVIAVKPA